MRSAREYAIEAAKYCDDWHSGHVLSRDTMNMLEVLIKKAQTEAYEAGHRAGQREMRNRAYNIALDECFASRHRSVIMAAIYELPIKPYGEQA